MLCWKVGPSGSDWLLLVVKVVGNCYLVEQFEEFVEGECHVRGRCGFGENCCRVVEC